MIKVTIGKEDREITSRKVSIGDVRRIIALLKDLKSKGIDIEEIAELYSQQDVTPNDSPEAVVAIQKQQAISIGNILLSVPKFLDDCWNDVATLFADLVGLTVEEFTSIAIVPGFFLVLEEILRVNDPMEFWDASKKLMPLQEKK